MLIVLWTRGGLPFDPVSAQIVAVNECIFSVNRMTLSVIVLSSLLCSVSNSIYKRKTNFLAKLKCSDHVLIGLFVLECYFYGIVCKSIIHALNLSLI